MVMQRSTAVMGADVEFPTDTLGIEVFARFIPIPTVAAVRGIDLPLGVCEWPMTYVSFIPSSGTLSGANFVWAGAITPVVGCPIGRLELLVLSGLCDYLVTLDACVVGIIVDACSL